MELQRLTVIFMLVNLVTSCYIFPAGILYYKLQYIIINNLNYIIAVFIIAKLMSDLIYNLLLKTQAITSE